jgi:hypothetical protein
VGDQGKRRFFEQGSLQAAVQSRDHCEMETPVQIQYRPPRKILPQGGLFLTSMGEPIASNGIGVEPYFAAGEGKSGFVYQGIQGKRQHSP